MPGKCKEKKQMNDYAESNNLDVTNPAPRCPVILLLDTSGSMSGQPLREL